MAVLLFDKIRVQVRFKHPGSGDIVNTYHMQAKSPWVGTPSNTAIMNAVSTWVSDAYSQLTNELHSGLAPYDLRVDKVDIVNGEEKVTEVIGTRTLSISVPPGGSGEALPHMNAAIVNFRTLIPKVFGRKYLGPWVEGRAADGAITSNGLANLALFVTKILTPAVVAGVGDLGVGVLSTKAAGDFFAELTEGVVNSVFGTQRRRRQNRGS
jgi:hypothetical protein